MFSARGEKIIDRIIEINILLLVFLMPITSIFFILTDFFVFESWTINDFFLVSFLTETLLLFFLIKVLSFGLEIKKKLLVYLMPFIVFVLVLCLSTFFSRAPWHSFWGLKERQMGLITWLHYLVFFTITLFSIKTQKQVKRILWAIIAAAAIVCVYGFLQFIGLDFQRWEEEVYLTGRIFSTFGQPNFLASYLLLVFPISVFGAIFSKKSAIRISLVCLSITILFCLIFTLSRGGWIGFVGEVLLFLMIYLWVKKHKKIIWFILSALLLLVVVVLVLNLFFKPADLTSIYKGVTMGNYSPLVFLKDRIIGLIFFNQGSGSARLFWWSKGLKLFTERPILGYGLEAQRYIFPYFYEPKVAIFQTINSYVDRAHNEIIDLLLVSGLMGLTAYIYLIIHILRFIFRDLKKDIDNYFSSENCLPLALLIGLFGCWISHQFSFAVVSAGFYIWLFTALIGVIILNKKNNGERLFNFKLTTPLSLKIFIIIVIIFSLSWFNWRHNISFYLSDHYFLKAVRALYQENWPMALDNYQRILVYQSNMPSYRQKLAMDLWQGVKFYPDKISKEKILEMAVKILEDIPAKERNFEVNAHLARILTELNTYQDKPDYVKTEKAFEYLASLSPRMAGIYNDWCQFEMIRADYEKAKEMCLKALSLYANSDDPFMGYEQARPLRDEMSQVYKKLGDIHFVAGKNKEAIDNYKTSLRLNPKTIATYKSIGDVYYKEGKLDEALKYNLHGYVLNPQDPNWPFAIALLYYEKGYIIKAKEYGQKALTLAPTDPEIKQFLNKLK